MCCAGSAQACFLIILCIATAFIPGLAPHLHPAPCALNPASYIWHPAPCYICAYTYAHTAKRCLDPPRATMFGAQRSEGVVQFAHALHTATSTSAITPTKGICAASSAYQIPRYPCVLHIRRPMYTHASMPVYNELHDFQFERARSFSASVFETSVQAYPKAQIRSSTLALKLCSRSVASSTLAAKPGEYSNSTALEASLRVCSKYRPIRVGRSFDTLAVFLFRSAAAIGRRS